MRTRVSLVILIVLIALAAGPVWAQGGGLQPAHLVLSVDNGTEARLNRMDWDVEAWAPLFPATSVRSNDYIDLQGRTTVMILCADLTLVDQRGSESPGCDPYAYGEAFIYADSPRWLPDDEARGAIPILSDESVPPEITDPGAISMQVLGEGDLAAITQQADMILNLPVSEEAQAFALSSLYRAQGLFIDSIRELTALPDIGCSARRPFVDPPSGDTISLVQSPVLYLRLGELFQLVAQDEDALRYYQCAAEQAEALSDPSSTALAYARQGAMAADPAEAIRLYQLAIDNYAALGATEDANAMLEICGSRNCTLP